MILCVRQKQSKYFDTAISTPCVVFNSFVFAAHYARIADIHLCHKNID